MEKEDEKEDLIPLLQPPSRKSKAISIIEPDTGKVLTPQERIPASIPANVTSAPTRDYQSIKYAQPPLIIPKHKTTQKPNPITGKLSVKPPISNLEDDSVAGDFEHAFDVYASPFVPQALKIINTSTGYIAHTPARNYLDFGAYFKGHLGVDFLPRIPESIVTPDHPKRGWPEVTCSRYEQYFRYHLEAEINSQESENLSYSIYEAPPIRSSREERGFHPGLGLEHLMQFNIPGLRENSPYIEEDDVVELRMLHHRYSRSPYVGQPPVLSIDWNGIVHESRVVRVQRKDEEIAVAITGLQIPTTHETPPRFNIRFPVQKKRYAPMHHVLPIIQEALLLHIRRAIDDKPETLRHWLSSMLFPKEEDGTLQTRLNPGAFNRILFDSELNREQQKAVESICLQNYGTLPYLISGPPGTGKTKTLVETALQLIKYDENVSHILICAPSDPATDTLVQRLSAHLKPDEMLRLNRPSRNFAEVPGSVLPYCHVHEGEFSSFALPAFEALMSYKVIVTTCRDASLLMYSRVSNYDLFAAEFGLRRALHPHGKLPEVELHWGALLIDEAAQAIEPEILLPLSVVATPQTSDKVLFMPMFVMVGDEYQLGPRTSNPTSALRSSLLGRLFKRPVYAEHPLARSGTGREPRPLNKEMLPILRPAFTNLIRNYRSHPAILAVPSALFYADTLVAEAANTDRLASWSQWKGKKWPVLFVSNNSLDDLEKDGGGWFNSGEAEIASWYASHLVNSGLVQPKEVCIMSPFKAQVARLRKTVRKTPGNWDVDIGPTEAFQGLEKGVVILCTTRSRQRFVTRDQKSDWGLIGMPNKMNVALTRAKFGLIVIGKTDVLMEDPNWKAFINFCERNGLMAGNETGGARLEGRGEPTRLERAILANASMEESSRVLGGVNLDDEMWINEQHDNMDMSENEAFDDHESEDH
jgi:hypothetical protein